MYISNFVLSETCRTDFFIAPWGGHGVFPNIYRDMRHPYKYPKALKVTYTFTVCRTIWFPDALLTERQYLLDLSMAIAGLLMFGEEVFDEVTSNIFCTKGYPPALSICIVIFIAIIPLTKIPLKYRFTRRRVLLIPLLTILSALDLLS